MFLSEAVQAKPVLPGFRHPVVLQTYTSQQSVLGAKAVNGLQAASEKHFQEAEGADPPSAQAPAGALCPVLDSPVQEIRTHWRASSERSGR